MDAILQNAVTKLGNILSEAYSLGLSDGTKEKYETPAMIEKFKEKFAEVCSVGDQAKEELKIASDFECTSIDNFDEKHRAAKAHFVVPNPKNTAKYQAFSNEIDKILKNANEAEHNINTAPNMHNLADDIEIQEENVLRLDPISKKLIINPVRNTICNHIYEESTIKEAIRLNNRTKCPCVGCGNNRAVKISDLVKDIDLRKQIEKARTQKAQLPVDSDEDSD